eukprot:scaffold9536_cov20-Tisochrysis_lutea.AAC.4
MEAANVNIRRKWKHARCERLILGLLAFGELCLAAARAKAEEGKVVLGQAADNRSKRIGTDERAQTKANKKAIYRSATRMGKPRMEFSSLPPKNTWEGLRSGCLRRTHSASQYALSSACG